MRFRTRVFLFSFVPFAVLLAFSFAMIQSLVQSTVREGLRSSMRENQQALARVRAKNGLQNSRFLSVVGENAALKAGVQLLLSEPKNEFARNTLEDQLRELCAHMNFDLLVMTAPDGSTLAGVLRTEGNFIPAVIPEAGEKTGGIAMLDGIVFRTASVDVDQGEENLGVLLVGEYLDYSEFNTPAVLLRKGHAVGSSMEGVGLSDVDRALAGCGEAAECDVRIRGVNYVSLSIEDARRPGGTGFVLRSLQNADAAATPVLARLRQLFLGFCAAAMTIALLCSIFSARTVVKPIAALISHLRYAERTGDLSHFVPNAAGGSGVREIRDLTHGFNRAAASVREARESLQNAYLQFVESLASALDARDPYTAGHSWRVSRLAVSTAEAMGLNDSEIQRIRVGALLHDIGKIGIADSLLQKPEALTHEEIELVKQHPEIGRRILEGVHGFAPFLAAVELHHENWDGTGYPHGQAGLDTPVDARIIHVTDAYDAMTSDRPYRRGMTHEQAIRILRLNAGQQFDPQVVEHFGGLATGNLAAQLASASAYVGVGMR